MRKISFRAAAASVVSLVFAAVCGLFVAPSVAAEELPEFRLTIHPTQNEFEEMLEPGASYTGKFFVRNDGQNEFDFTISYAPYSVISESYTPVYDKETVYTEISKWIAVDHDEGTLKKGQEAEIHYTVNVPADAHGGSQAATILVTMNDHVDVEEGSGVKTVRQLGYIVMGNVDGEITKAGKILENKIPTFLFNPPIYGTSVVENTGNVYTAAQYTLQVFPLFSDEEVYTNEEKPEDSIIFPETKRFNQINWEGAPHLGIFKVRQTVKIFDEESVTEKIVFLCPIWFLFIVLLLIFCIIFWLVSRAFRRKREA